jgi:threonine dehydratase
MTGLDVHIKAENFQKTGSFKPRGMLNKLLSMSEREKAAGAITFSAGNAAQGLAYAGSIAGVNTTIVMPASASRSKVQATREYGGEVIFVGSPAECMDHCLELAKDRGLTFVSSYDDEALIIGHASLGLEIAEDLGEVDAIIVGIGGGGLAAGIGLAMSTLDLKTKLFGVEPEGAPAMSRSLEAGKPVRLEKAVSIADGLAAPSAGASCYEIVRDRYETVLLVADHQIAEAMKLLMTRCKLFVEPAGAAALAALLTKQVGLPPGARVVLVASGGNIDLDRLATILVAPPPSAPEGRLHDQ